MQYIFYFFTISLVLVLCTNIYILRRTPDCNQAQNYINMSSRLVYSLTHYIRGVIFEWGWGMGGVDEKNANKNQW